MDGTPSQPRQGMNSRKESKLRMTCIPVTAPIHRLFFILLFIKGNNFFVLITFNFSTQARYFFMEMYSSCKASGNCPQYKLFCFRVTWIIKWFTHDRTN